MLKVAGRLFLTQGLEGLTMEKLAAATPYSKGTVYQVFRSREDVLAGLCIEGNRFRLGMLERAALFKGRSRERALAVAKADFLVYKLNPEYWVTEELVSLLRLATRVSPARKSALDSLTVRCVDVAMGVVRDAVAAGDLSLPEAISPEKLLLALVALTRGIYLLGSADAPIRGWDADHPSTHELLLHHACDGFGWRPFLGEWDYEATTRRIWREVFPSEATRLGLGEPQAGDGTVTLPHLPPP